MWRLVLVLLILSGCNSPHKSKGQIARLNLVADPETIDPRLTYKLAAKPICLMLFEGLTRIGPEGRPELALAESYEVSEDGRHYTFHLRDALWSNGEPIVANDFVRTWKSLLDPSFPATHAYQLFLLRNGQEIKQGRLSASALGVTAVNDHELKVELEHPAPYFLDLLANNTYFPVHASTEINSDWDHHPPPCSGPFCLTEWRLNQRLVVCKNPLYWDADSVRLDGIDMQVLENQATELYLHESGEIDWTGTPFSRIPFAALPELQQSGQLNCHPIAGVYWYKVNTRHPPLNNKKVRQALSLAIDRDQLANFAHAGAHVPADGVIPPMLHGTERHGRIVYDPDRARALLEQGLSEQGLSLEDLQPIELSYNVEPEHLKIAQAIQQQWQTELNLPVEIVGLDWAVHLDRLVHGQFDVARMAWYASFNDEIDFLNVFRYTETSGYVWLNDTGWTNIPYVDLLDAADFELDPKRRAEMLSLAEEMLVDGAPVIPLLFIHYNYLHSPRLQGVTTSHLGSVDFKRAYLRDRP